MAVRSRRGGPRARYRVRNWAAYDCALLRRAGVRLWISPEAVKGWRAPAGCRTFTDTAIAAAFAVRAVYRLVLRQAKGLICFIFALVGFARPFPDHMKLSRRGRTLQFDRGDVHTPCWCCWTAPPTGSGTFTSTRGMRASRPIVPSWSTGRCCRTPRVCSDRRHPTWERPPNSLF